MLHRNDTKRPPARGIGTTKRQAINQPCHTQRQHARQGRASSGDNQRLQQRKHHEITPRKPNQPQQRKITLLAFHIGIKPNAKRNELPKAAQAREQGK